MGTRYLRPSDTSCKAVTRVALDVPAWGEELPDARGFIGVAVRTKGLPCRAIEAEGPGDDRDAEGGVGGDGGGPIVDVLCEGGAGTAKAGFLLLDGVGGPEPVTGLSTTGVLG